MARRAPSLTPARRRIIREGSAAPGFAMGRRPAAARASPPGRCHETRHPAWRIGPLIVHGLTPSAGAPIDIGDRLLDLLDNPLPAAPRDRHNDIRLASSLDPLTPPDTTSSPGVLGTNIASLPGDPSGFRSRPAVFDHRNFLRVSAAGAAAERCERHRGCPMPADPIVNTENKWHTQKSTERPLGE